MVKVLEAGQPSVKRKPKPADWPGMRMLYATGTSMHDLAKVSGIKYGTIRSRSSRECWDLDKQRVQQIATDAATQTQSMVASLRDRGQTWLSRVAAQTDRYMDVLEKEDVETLSDVKRVTPTMDHVDKIARRNYGHDQEHGGAGTIVNLGFLQDYKPATLETSAPTLELENAGV